MSLDKEELEFIFNEIALEAENLIKEHCRNINDIYPLAMFFENLDALIDKLAFNYVLAKWCIENNKNLDDFKELISASNI